jgi:hypothetical protein
MVLLDHSLNVLSGDQARLTADSLKEAIDFPTRLSDAGVA